MTDDLDRLREEQERLCDGLARLSDNTGIPDLDQEMLDGIHRRAMRGRWQYGGVLGLAVAAAMVVVAGIVINQVLFSSISAVFDSPASSSTGGGDAGRDVSVEPEAPHGMRWERLQDVIVGIPEDWPYGDAPRDLRSCLPADGPYVDVNYVKDTDSSAGGCENADQDASQVMHVTLNNADDPEPWHPASSVWLVQSRIVSGVRISVTCTAEQTVLATQILDTAQVTRK
jgi:hypothetical protein